MGDFKKIGIHTGIIKDYKNTYQHIINNNLNACQLNINGLDIQDIIAARKFLETTPNFYTCFHSNVIYNLAGSAKGSADIQFNRKLNNTKRGLLNELDISTMIGNDIVVHIGSHPDKNVGIRQIANTLNEVLIIENSNTIGFSRITDLSLSDFKNKRRILLENSAGLGKSIGTNLEDISIILSLINPQLKDNVNICIDTCHACDAGEYDFSTPEGVENFYQDIDRKIPGKLKLFHLNDSMYGYGSRKDRHQHLTYGKLFNNRTDGLKELIQESIKRDIPMVGEYPEKYGNSMDDMRLIKNLLS